MRLEYRPFTATSDPKNPPQVIEVLVAELGQLGLGLLGARRERAPPPSRRGRDRCALPGVGPYGRLRGHGVLAALGKNLFDLGVRAGNDVY